MSDVANSGDLYSLDGNDVRELEGDGADELTFDLPVFEVGERPMIFSPLAASLTLVSSGRVDRHTLAHVSSRDVAREREGRVLKAIAS